MPENNTPSRSIDIVRQTIREAYGFEGSLSLLPGENLNFLVHSKTGQKYIAKIAGKETPPEVVEMEYAALQHAAKAQSHLLFPQVIENIYGIYETGIKNHINNGNRLRLLSYVGGHNLSDRSDISDSLRFSLGESLAGFGLAMADFDHPAAHRRHRWNLADAAQHQGKAVLVKDPLRRKLLNWAFAQLTNCVSPVLTSLRWQFIHGDANPENIRVDGERVVGFLDFGDSCYNPSICDLAICLAYQMMDQADPWTAAEQVIRGYETVRTLSKNERVVLLPLVCGRLAVTISVASERRQIDPENANWFVSEIPAWRLLTQLHSSARSQFPKS